MSVQHFYLDPIIVGDPLVLKVLKNTVLYRNRRTSVHWSRYSSESSGAVLSGLIHFSILGKVDSIDCVFKGLAFKMVRYEDQER